MRAGWDPAAKGLGPRHASPIAFRKCGSAVIRRAASAGARPAPPSEVLLKTLGELVGELDQRVFSLTPHPDRLRRLYHRVAQLKIELARTRTRGLPDTDLGRLEAVLTHLHGLLQLVKELDDVAQTLHRLAADLRTRALAEPPRPSVGRP
jgi:hypothetical protein